MKTSVILSAIAAATPVLGSIGHWVPPGTYDRRGPCPMLNTLANHGRLPRDGRDIDRETTETVLLETLNLNRSVSSNLFDFAITTNPTPNATTFSLDDLGNHNILEHDASLSRTDAYFGSTATFNQTIFDETRMYWTDEIIDFKTATDAVVARAETSNKTNPEFFLSELGVDFSFGESVAFIYILGDIQTKTVNRSWVEYWFTHEQMPEHLGWEKPKVMLHPDDFFDGIDELEAIAAAMSPEYVAGLKRRMPHGRF